MRTCAFQDSHETGAVISMKLAVSLAPSCLHEFTFLVLLD